MERNAVDYNEHIESKIMNILNKEIISSDPKVWYLFKFVLLTIAFSFLLNLAWMMVFGMFWAVGVSELYLGLFLLGVVIVSGIISYLILKKI